MPKELPSSKQSIDPIQSFFDLESQLGNKIIKMISTHFEYLTLILRGTQLMTMDMHSICNDLWTGKTPQAWIKVWEGPDEPITFLKSVIYKVKRITNWSIQFTTLLNGPSIPLSGFLRPCPLLNAFRQKSGQLTCYSLESLGLVCSWDLNSIEKNVPYLAIDGLSIQGCKFDGTRLYNVDEKDSTLSTVPTCYLYYLPKVISNRFLLNRF